MIKLNNKGQSLVMFIILIPMMLLMFVLVYDIGNAIYEKDRLSNVCYMVTDYGLSNYDKVNENDLIDLIMKNTKNVTNVSVIVSDNSVDVSINKSIKSVFDNVFDLDIHDVNCEYHGVVTDGKKKIERVK